MRMKLSDVHFGKVRKPLNWRKEGIVEGKDEDELLTETPDDVTGILGFDPLEFEEG